MVLDMISMEQLRLITIPRDDKTAKDIKSLTNIFPEHLDNYKTIRKK